jgi:hypothetical protein
MDTVGIRVPTEQIREFSTFSVASAVLQPGASLVQLVYADFLKFLAKTYYLF